jgi:hypothetical protein
MHVLLISRIFHFILLDHGWVIGTIESETMDEGRVLHAPSHWILKVTFEVEIIDTNLTVYVASH